MGRRGVFFSMAALVFVLLLSLVISSSLRAPKIDTNLYSAKSTGEVRERIEAVYFPLILRTVGTRTIIDIASQAEANDEVLNLPDDFNTAMESGTWGSNTVSYNTLNQELVAFQTLSDTTGTKITAMTVDPGSVDISQIGTFTAQVKAKISYTLESPDGKVIYDRPSVEVIAEIPLQSVPDLYFDQQAIAAGVPNIPPRVFRAHLPKIWDNAEFNVAYSGGLYMLNKGYGGSVFDRLEGLNPANPSYGIETFVDSATILPTQTSIDREYFPATVSLCTYSVLNPVTSVPYPNLQVSFTTLTEYRLLGSLKTGDAATCQVAPTSYPPLP